MSALSNPSILEGVNTAYRNLAEDFITNASKNPGTIEQFCDFISTDSIINEVDLVSAFPLMREWVGEKQFQAFKAYKQIISTKPHEASMKIPRTLLKADKSGLIAKRFSNFLSEQAGAFDRLGHIAMFANPVGYDGVALFSSAHPRADGGGNQSNTTSTALSFAQYDAVMVAGSNLVLDNGEPAGIAYDTLVVGPKLARLAQEITGSNERVQGINAAGATDPGASIVAAAAVTNVYGGGSMNLIVDKRLVGTADDYYYFLDTSKSAKALQCYIFEDLHAEEATDMASSNRFLRDELLYSVEGHFGFGAGFWPVAYAGLVA